MDHLQRGNFVVMGDNMEISLNQNTYEQLKKDIMTLMLRPGDAISAAKIAERYQVSRTPAREAIVKLEKDGLVDIFPKSKTLISKINLDRAKQEWFVRRSLEISIVDDFMTGCTEETIDRLEQNLDVFSKSLYPIASYEYYMLDQEFHNIIYEAAGQYWAEFIINSLITHYNRMRFIVGFTEEVRQKTYQEHQQIVAAAKNHDADLMRKTLDIHIQGTILKDMEMKQLFPKYFTTGNDWIVK